MHVKQEMWLGRDTLSNTGPMSDKGQQHTENAFPMKTK